MEGAGTDSGREEGGAVGRSVTVEAGTVSVEVEEVTSAAGALVELDFGEGSAQTKRRVDSVRKSPRSEGRRAKAEEERTHLKQS